MANKTIRDFHGSFNVSEAYTTYKSEDQIDEATPPSGPKATRPKDEKSPPSGPKNPNKPHVKTPAPTYVRNKPRYSRYTGSSRRGMIDDEGYRSDGSNPVDDAIRRRNAARRRAAARNEEITVGEELGITEGDKSEYSKLMKQYGDMPMSKVPMKTRLKIRELGRKVRGDKPMSGLRASDLVDDMKRRQMGEAKTGEVANAARKGMPPYTIVAIQGLNPPKVVAQETTMIASAVPAHVKEMKSNYPKAKISVEGKSGKILHTEQMNEAKAEYEVKYSSSKRGPIKVTKFMSQGEAQAFLKKIRGEGMNGIVSKSGKVVREDIEQTDESMIGRTKPSRELNVQKFEKKYLGTKSLKDAKRAAHKAERKKGKMDIQKGD